MSLVTFSLYLSENFQFFQPLLPCKDTFYSATTLPITQFSWGTNKVHSDPTVTQAKRFVGNRGGSSKPGGGHNFHKHPNQEEVIYVVEGEIEQWVDQEKRRLGPGDSAFIPADMVHASFNVSDQPAKFLAILGHLALERRAMKSKKYTSQNHGNP